MPRDTINEQFWLLPYENPLEKRMGREFFGALPTLPGVYLIRGDSGLLLYVGKAKNLRIRLQSYKRATPDRVSRKVIRMIHLTRRIDWEICESEEAALLRENQLLRTYRPPFNVVNVNPESYLFVAFRETENGIRLRLAGDETRETPDEMIYGAFKGGGFVRDGYAALLRLLWACHCELEQLGFPAHLTRRRALPFFEIALKNGTEDWPSLIRRFLNGTASTLLLRFTETLLEDETIPRFLYSSIQDDLETLGAFYDHGPHRNRALRRHHGLENGVPISQYRLDDLLTLYRLAD